MPFVKYLIEPINVSECEIPRDERNELECVSNLTLANLMRQLSALGSHANRLFADLATDAMHIATRSKMLSERIQRLQIKAAQLDIQTEEVSLLDCHNKNQFKSANSNRLDQVLSRSTMPEAMQILYENADPPPELYKLNPYRIDGQDCMKFYTDPDFFFRLWRQEIMKENEARKLENKKRRKAKQSKSDLQKPRDLQPLNEKHKHMAQGVEFMPNDIYMSHMQAKLLKESTTNNSSGVYGHLSTPISALIHQQLQPNHQFNQQNGVYGTTRAQNPPAQMQRPATNMQNYMQSSRMTSHIGADYAAHQHHQQTYNQSIITVDAQPHHQNGHSNHEVPISPSGRSTGSNNERPMMPPPPVPVTIPQQKATNPMSNINAMVSSVYSREDLPPPPSPPDFLDDDGSAGAKFKRAPTPPSPISPDVERNFELPLPPPPMESMEITSTTLIATSTVMNGVAVAPVAAPPPPPPPLPTEFFSAKGGLVGETKVLKELKETKKTTPVPNETDKARNTLLEDIRNREFRLRKIKENERKEKEKEPFAASVSDVLDIIFKRGDYMNRSSDEDDDGSDWDND